MFTLIPLALRAASEQIAPGEWLSLITLCLAPLIVHILVGVPRPVYLYEKLPRWDDEIGFYNPTTILWRYFAVTDRRLRAKTWSPIDTAATNHRFWTVEGWDGSEGMVQKSREFCTRVPVKSRINFVSKTAAETLVTTAQGVAAIVDFTGAGNSGPGSTWNVSLATIFYPLAVFGLSRLPAALWLAEDGSYTDVDMRSDGHDFAMTRNTCDSETDGPSFYSRASLPSATEALLRASTYSAPYTTHPALNWRGLLIRLFFNGFIFGLLAINFLVFIPRSGRPISFTSTEFLETMFYLFIVTMCFIVMNMYIWRPQVSTTTIIPCIQSFWYKAYTIVFFAFGIFLVCMAVVETRRQPCGTYSTRQGDGTCIGAGGIFLDSAKTDYPNVTFNGSATTASGKPVSQYFEGLYFGSSGNSSTGLHIVPFTGWCKGDVLADVNITLPYRKMNNATDWVGNIEGNVSSTNSWEAGISSSKWLSWLYG